MFNINVSHDHCYKWIFYVEGIWVDIIQVIWPQLLVLRYKSIACVSSVTGSDYTYWDTFTNRSLTKSEKGVWFSRIGV